VRPSTSKPPPKKSNDDLGSVIPTKDGASQRSKSNLKSDRSQSSGKHVTFNNNQTLHGKTKSQRESQSLFNLQKKAYPKTSMYPGEESEGET